ncbi:MAG TPA: metallophosphoesterase [Vicinamibacterales bacterium]|nr:metallophosphoesterase [Vicinamibacterales bacterium]
MLALVLSVGAGAQAPAATAPFFFLQFSDPQFGMFSADKEFSQETVNIEMAISTANRLKPAFVVVTGDLVNKAGDAAQIAEYKRIAAKLDKAIPLYSVAGNHDVENEPTPESVAAYLKSFGPDHYTFRSGSFAGVVLNSSVIHSPGKAADLPQSQLTWLMAELTRLKQSGARHLVIFQHHPWFLKADDEPDQYFNIPLARRSSYLDIFKQAGVTALISGHYHRNAVARSGSIDMITTGPVGKPLGDNPQSGMRVVIVRDDGLSHRFYSLGELPAAIDLTSK